MRWLCAFVVSCWRTADGTDCTDEPVLTQKLRCGVLIRFAAVAMVMLLLFGWLARHIYVIQVVRHEEFAEKSLALCQRSNTRSGQRGRIMDLNGNLFSCDVATMNIYAEPKRFAARIDDAVKVMADMLDLDEADLKRRFEQAAKYNFSVELSRNVGPDFIQRHRLIQIPGVRVKPVYGKNQNRTVISKVLFYPAMVDRATRRRSYQQLARIFKLDEYELIQAGDQAMQRCAEVSVKRDVSREVAEAAISELRRLEIRGGVRAVDSWIRSYPRDNSFANMLGYLNTERHGVSGIEALMDQYLQPKAGTVTYKRDRHGRPVEDSMKYDGTPQNGADVYLTIQEPLQQIVEEELAALWEKHSPLRAYAIMVDPTTGAVMALAQYPQCNPNDRETFNTPVNIQNHCLVQSYDPGSVMKAISLSGVLDNHVARLDTTVDCEGGRWYYGGRPLQDTHQYDKLTLAEVIQKSSNIGTAKFSMLFGEEAMFKYLTGYQLGRRTGLGYYPPNQKPVYFKSEAMGSFRSLRTWDTLTITRIPIGQGLSMTPLQIVQSWQAIANGGVIMQPYIVDRVKFADGRVEYSQPRVKATPVSAEAAAQMTEALKLVVQKGGTAVRAAIPGYQVAGKTGTAQLCLPTVVKNRRGEDVVRYLYSNTKNFASFVGFVPADKPRFLLLVSAEAPSKNGRTGSSVSAPVFKRIATRTLEYMQVPSDMPEVETTNSAHTANNSRLGR